MATINRDFFTAQFREEANDHIQRITQKLFHLEEEPGEPKQLLEEVFRIAHTLKGSSRMMGYTDISTLAHKMEDLFVEIRDGHLELRPTVTDLLFYCLDTINYLVEGLYKNVKRTANIDELISLFNDLLAGKDIKVPHLPSQFVRPSQRKKTTAILPARPEAVPDEAEERQYVRIHTKDLDTILNLVGEVLINQYRYDEQFTAFQEIVRELQEHQHQIAELREIVNAEGSNSSYLRLPQLSERLEDFSSELLRKTRVLVKQIRTDGQQMHLAIDKLQEQAIDIRMVPASRIFHLCPRLVRMTSRGLGKAIELVILGEDTKIDSRIIEEMRNPLIHLVQNAIRHGIEPQEERQKGGKNPTGIVRVSASQEGNRIIIRVQDDGKGIDVERIKEVAVETGLISSKDAQAINEQELYEFLFQPGFSTAETVDDIAGRGFGLDIVRDHVDRVQGEIEIHSHPGQGTEFVIKLPLTLTIMNALLVQIADEVFAFPTAAVEKTFDIHPDEIEHLGKVPIVVADGSLLPVVELRKILHSPERHPIYEKDETYLSVAQDTSYRTVIVVQSQDRRIGFLVEDLVEEREIVVKPLGSCLKRVRNVAGATTLREDIVIILFVRDLVRSADALLEEIPAQAMLLQEDLEGQDDTKRFNKRVPKILVVEDSLNTREVERMILENAGYRVETATNGSDGLAKLKDISFDLVVTDIEMPEMDGWQLIRHMKHDNALHEIPVIIVSTRGTEEDKQNSLNMGVDAYIVKGEFDEQTLLHAVDACLKG